MGDTSHSCRGLETPTLGHDLWPMGFDVDLALDGPSVRKGPGCNLVTNGVGNGGLNALQSTGNNPGAGGYNDIHHLSSLSSILQRFDDFHTGDICQMTDLTNSLPKGDSETAQSLLAKLACQDLGPDLSSGADASHRELESSLFGQTSGGVPHGVGNNVSLPLTNKAPLESADVYGRMTCYGGKLILQLRHFNLNTNYTLNVGVCWLCGEKVNPGSQLCTHKHSLNGIFQVNDEYVQLDIDHYIIPDHALDPPDTHDMTDTVLHQSDSSGLHHDLSTSQDLELSENITGGGDGLTMVAGGPLHYSSGPHPGMVPPLNSASNNVIGPTVPTNPSPCLNSTFSQLPLPGMPLTGSQNGINSGVSALSVSGNLNTQPLCTVSAAVTSLNQVDTAVTNTVLTPSNQRNVSAQGNHMSVSNGYPDGSALNTINVHSEVNNASYGHSSHRDFATARGKSSLQWHIPVSGGDEYSCQATETDDKLFENHVQVTSSITPLNSVSTNFDSRIQRNDVALKRTEIGAKKRKSRAQRKPSVIQMRDHKNEDMDVASVKQFQVQVPGPDSLKSIGNHSQGNIHVRNASVENQVEARSDTSIEDLIRHNLPEGELLVMDNQVKSNEMQPKSSPESLKYDGKQSLSDSTDNSVKQGGIVQKTIEPDQTSRLAAHMLAKGFDLACRLCLKEYGKDIKNYKKHMKEHGVKEEAYFPCCFCTKSFAKGKHYTQHLRTHERTRRFSCHLCTASYSREAKLRRHIMNHSQKRQKFACSKCPKSFRRKDYLRKHYLNIHIGKKYKCEICGFLCSSPYNLGTHRKQHLVDKPFKCELCERAFVRRDFLDNHMEQIHKNKKSKCDICGKLFSRKDVLKRHLKVHNTSETYDCEVCCKKFTRKDQLSTHRKSHKLKCDYKCSICPATFLRKTVLSKHEKIHKTKDQCKICYKFLPSKVKLESHMKLHEKQNSGEDFKDGENFHKCDVCSKVLTSKDVLRRHKRKVHGKLQEPKKKPEGIEREKRFFCEWCSKGFTRSCNLNTHLLKAHSKDADDDELEDLPSVLHSSKLESSYMAKQQDSTPSASLSFCPTSYHTFSASFHNTVTAANQNIADASGGLSFPVNIPASSPSLTSPHSAPQLPLQSSHFPSSGPPDSPINLSTDAITGAAFLLAYPSYPGSY